mmetsp:Transcript_8941/g.29859  ORF Transcript_8941/g.29859 Transcript_8941/m.29859 type:complete len:125 (-) Transcript_8941:119-493(-)
MEALRCLLYGSWLPHHPKGVLDLVRTRRHGNYRHKGKEDTAEWTGSYIFCNGWEYSNSADPRFFYPVVIRMREQGLAQWFDDSCRAQNINYAIVIIALLFLYQMGFELAAFSSMIALWLLSLLP